MTDDGIGVAGAAPRSTVRPLWSVDLGLGPSDGLGLDARNRWLVATPTTLASFETDGRRRWTVDVAGRAQPLVTTADAAIVRIEGDEVVHRDPDSGQVRWSFAAPRSGQLRADPWGGLVYSQTAPDGPTMLCCTSMTGAPRWSRPLAGRGQVTFTPFAMDDTVIVCDGGLLRAYDRDGQVRWLAGHDSFHDAGDGIAPGDEMWTPLRRVTPTTLLAGLDWDTGHGLFLLDVASRTVRPYPVGFRPRSPVAVLSSPERGYQVAVQGPTYEVRQMDWQWSVALLDPAGASLWEHRLHAPPLRLVRGAGDTLVVSGTPTRERWDDYHRWQDLSADTYVRCLGPDGSPLWTWYGPGPLSNHPLVGPDGVIYVGSEGRVWALPPAGPGVRP